MTSRGIATLTTFYKTAQSAMFVTVHSSHLHNGQETRAAYNSTHNGLQTTAFLDVPEPGGKPHHTNSVHAKC